MKKISSLLTILFLFGAAAAVPAAESRFKSSGEVVSADPLYARVTIRHGAIKGFSGDAETEFAVASTDLLKGVRRRDLVEFEFTEEGGDARIDRLTRTGVAPPEEDPLPIGRAVQDVLEATGEVAKGLTSPVPPAHEVVSGTVGAATDATGSVLEDAKGPAVKKDF